MGLRCKGCGGEEHVKNGFMRGKQRYRRLRVDDETSNETSRHMTILASLFMTGMRLERMLRA